MPIPSDFAARKLTIEYLNSDPLLRIFKTPSGASHAPIYYGNLGRNRFDSPAKAFGVIYAAFDLSTCFAETITREGNRSPLHNCGIPVSDAADVQTRFVATLQCQRPLKLANMTDAGLYAVGAEAGEFNSVDYPATTQLWAQEIYSRPEMVDGIFYRSRFLNGRIAVAIFDRGGLNVKLLASSVVPLPQHPSYPTALKELNICLLP